MKMTGGLGYWENEECGADGRLRYTASELALWDDGGELGRIVVPRCGWVRRELAGGWMRVDGDGWERGLESSNMTD